MGVVSRRWVWVESMGVNATYTRPYSNRAQRVYHVYSNTLYYTPIYIACRR